LPIDAKRWSSLFARQVRRTKDLQRVYDDSETCLIAISHPALGTVSLRCEREFAPLRWAPGQDGNGPFVRLIDNTESADVALTFFEFPLPDRPITPDMDVSSRVRSRSGGLVVANVGDSAVRVILPPFVRRLEDLSLTPQLADRPRSLREVIALLELASAWSTASLPADPFGETGRARVLGVMTVQLAGLVGGQRWARLEERRAASERSIGVEALQDAVGEAPYQRALAAEIVQRIDEMTSSEPAECARLFAGALAMHARPAGARGEDFRLAEFLLRLASAPASLTDWPPQELRSRLQLTLDSPVLLRAGRLVILSLDVREETRAVASFEGWSWE